MKKKITILMLFFASVAGGCKSYLDTPVEASMSTEQLFGNYHNFQGYIDQVYFYVEDPIKGYLTSSHNHGGETISATAWATGYKGIRSDYKNYLGRGYFQIAPGNAEEGYGIWTAGWRAIRAVNVGLANLDLLRATEAEKGLIEGQLLFFRAYFHFEILSAWGSIPFLNEVLVEDYQKPRFYEYKGKKNYQACTEYIAEDLARAAELLPEVWGSDGANRGRITRMAAYGYLAKSLLYAGSPLMNLYSGNSATVDVDYMKRAADAAGKAIAIDQTTSAYELVEWSKYQSNFATVDGNMPWTSETVWGKYKNDKGTGGFDNRIGRIMTPDVGTFGGNAVNETVTQNYVDLFEMADGTLYNSGSYDNDNDLRWNSRDPRFRQNIYVDRDRAGIKDATILELYTSGKSRRDNCQTPYFIHKFWPKGVNKKVDNGPELANFRYMSPMMRLADIYLMYAEAVNEGFGNAAAMAGGANLSALEAVNKVRQRAGHVPTDAMGGAHGSFRKMILNERAVELCFEGQYWYDIRRWMTAPEANNTAVYDLVFDKDWNSFTRREILRRVFEAPKHWWLPFPQSLTQMYKEFPQNEGWD